MDFFNDHAVAFALICGGVAVLYGLYLTYWLLSQSPGNERMQEISGAVQEGAAAYLKKQYTTIAVVAIVPFLLLGFYNELGWGTAFGFIIGAAPLRRRGLHRHERRRAVERPYRRGGARGVAAGVQGRVPGRLGDGPARRRARACSASRATTGSSPGRSATRRSPRSTTSSASPSAARSSRYSRVSAAASSRRPPTSAPTSSARSRRASPRTTRATRP